MEEISDHVNKTKEENIKWKIFEENLPVQYPESYVITHFTLSFSLSLAMIFIESLSVVQSNYQKHFVDTIGLFNIIIGIYFIFIAILACLQVSYLQIFFHDLYKFMFIFMNLIYFFKVTKQSGKSSEFLTKILYLYFIATFLSIYLIFCQIRRIFILFLIDASKDQKVSILSMNPFVFLLLCNVVIFVFCFIFTLILFIDLKNRKKNINYRQIVSI
jgi:hypothetical protein